MTQPNLVSDKSAQLPLPLFANEVGYAGGCYSSRLGTDNIAMAPIGGIGIQYVLRYLGGLSTSCRTHSMNTNFETLSSYDIWYLRAYLSKNKIY